MMMKKLSTLLLLFTCTFAVECVSEAGKIIVTCSPENLSLDLAAGESGNVSFQCCFTSSGGESFRVMVHNRDEWFIQVEQPDGSFKSVQELFPASIYVSDILAPETATASEVFDVVISMALSSSYSGGVELMDAGIEVLVDTTLETDPSSQVTVSLQVLESPPEEPPSEETFCGDGTCDPEESCSTCSDDCGTCPPPEEPPSDPISEIVETVKNIVTGKSGESGGSGSGGGGGLTILPTTEPEPETQSQSSSSTQPQNGGSASAPGTEPPAEEPGIDIQPLQLPDIEIPEVDLSANYVIMGIGVVALVILALAFKAFIF